MLYLHNHLFLLSRSIGLIKKEVKFGSQKEMFVNFVA